MIFYGSKIWVVMGEMLKVLERFHHQAEWKIMGLAAKHGAGEEW